MQTYIANAGQTYQPIQDNIHIPFVPYERPADPQLPPMEIRDDYAARGYYIASEKQHFLPGVTAEMMDWFWANMDKGYYLWAPGSHKRFSWVKSPVEVGFTRSVHCIAEACAPEAAVFGGEGIEISRIDVADFFPFKTSLSHVIVEGFYNAIGELANSTIHMWEDAPGGCNHIVITVENNLIKIPPQFVLDILAADPDAKIVPNHLTDHDNYEASQWPVFLPTLYGLWKNHPDPSQNVHVDLRVEPTETGYRYIAENGPVVV